MGPIFLQQKKRLQQQTHKLGAWYQGLARSSKAREAEPLGMQGGMLQAPRQRIWGAGSHTAGGMEGVSPPVKTIHGSCDPEPGFRDQDLVFLFNKYEIWFELGPYGSVGAHIKTGQRYVPQDNFKTLVAPKTAME